MTIKDIRVFSYALPLARPLIVKGEHIPTKDGFIVQIIADNGAEGIGEIAPLINFSPETSKAALAQINFLREILPKAKIPANIEKLDGALSTWLKEFKLKPSVQFGMEMAVLNLLANHRKTPLYKLLSAEHHDHIRVNGLLQGTKLSIKEEARKLLEAGFTTMKLKVGANIDEAIILVRTVNEVIEGKALLNIDANQQWDLEKAVEFGTEVGLAAVNYIEEPFTNLDEIPEFYQRTLIPVALDESLQTKQFDEVKGIEGVDFIVLKPTVLGGIEKTWHWINNARRLALEPVISSTFESGVGIATLASLAGAISRDYSAGLDTLKWFEKDLLINPLVTDRGKINIANRIIKLSDIRPECLHEV